MRPVRIPWMLRRRTCLWRPCRRCMRSARSWPRWSRLRPWSEGRRMPRIIASIEARMASSRLPGKVLADVYGQPALTRLVHRLRRCTTVHDMILATSVSPADDVLEAWAQAEYVPVYRGSEADVLARVVEAQRAMAADIVVEITGDCILLDPDIIDLGV